MGRGSWAGAPATLEYFPELFSQVCFIDTGRELEEGGQGGAGG